MCVTVLQRVAHALRTSSAAMKGSVSLSLGCVTPTETAVMGQMNLPPAVSSLHLHLMF